MTSTGRSYFEEMYRYNADPWGFESSPYEQRKYAVTVASLPRSRYRSAYEPGCSVGVLSEQLANRCDRLLSSDIIPSALRRAKTRLREASHVRVQERSIPDQWPPGPFDLVVLSEIAYYFDVTDLGCVVACVIDSTTRGAHVVGVHWRGETDYPLTGERSHRIIAETAGLVTVVHHIEEEFVLDIWERQ
ncbi:MAG TPA: SAM-dependent methyltransferase [Acidimicrobiales bacterium]|jgi:SAM-dependent methyltransferase|nr:SAM-dependent methyltransferase [Acidimicrobiales bacterium]